MHDWPSETFIFTKVSQESYNLLSFNFKEEIILQIILKSFLNLLNIMN